MLLQSTSPVSGWITQSEYLRRPSTTYFLSMRAVLLWNDFCTSATHKNNYTLSIFFCRHHLFIIFFPLTFQCVWLLIGMPLGLNINDQTCQSLNLNNFFFFAARLISYVCPFLIEFRRETEGEAVMKCEHLCRHVLHVCAALKVSASYFHCAISGWS